MPKTTRTRYSLEDRERGLAALVIAGSSIRASEVTGISDATLRTWKQENPDRYEALRHELEPQVARTIAAEAETIALKLSQVEHDLADALTPDVIGALKPSDVASTLRNVSTSKALQVDKISSPLRERPSHVQHSTGVDELVSKLNRALGFDVTSTAVELESRSLTTESDVPNVRDQASSSTS
jgi:transposase-like protein